MTDAETLPLKDEFLRELKSLEDSGAALPFLLTPGEAWCLLSALQLALRHPQFQPDGDPHHIAADWAYKFARHIQDRLCILPALAQIAEMGWDSANPIV